MRKLSNESSSLPPKVSSHSNRSWIRLTESLWVNFGETLRTRFICCEPRRYISRDI